MRGTPENGMTDVKPKYAIQKLQGGWVVVMASNGHIMAKWFDTERAAAVARDQFERGERSMDKKTDVWVIAERFVCEAGLGGMQIGEARSLDMNQYNVVARFSQAEFDEMMNEFNGEEGHYPDT
jgi:hypothetical protein